MTSSDGPGATDSVCKSISMDKSNGDTAATVATSSKGSPKKKKPIQHLVAGGAAGLVESSVCHPLDTIKTRMQLRRQNTRRGNALGSLRDVAGNRALHRRVGDAAATKKSADGVAAKMETVRVKPTAAARDSSATSMAAGQMEPGWKQRVASYSTAAARSPSATAATAAAARSSSSSSASVATAATGPVVAPLGPFGTARRIVQREGPLALYKGLTAVYTGIIPKMAIRFVSFEYYRDVMGGWYGSYYNIQPTSGSAHPPAVTFIAGLASGLTEAVAVVTPAEVCKIRMQSQYHSLIDPSQMKNTKYRNVVQTAFTITREEGIGALYKGVVPTMLRQGCNQAVNFTVYNWVKKKILEWKAKKTGTEDVQLEHWQSLMLGGFSGGMGPMVNNPLGELCCTPLQRTPFLWLYCKVLTHSIHA